MAIEFARMQIVSRSAGGNACCKASYNARIKLKDERTNVTYNFTSRGDNVYHTVLLPEGVDEKFKDPAILMNEVERTEKRKNSQLLKDIVIALPDDKELDLQDRINITHEIIDKMGWVKEGLGVQVDIHKPHDGEKNWHAHLLVTTRRFTPDGRELGEKARDLNPEFRSNKQSRGFIIPEETMLHEHVRDVINGYFEKLGLENRVDLINAIPQEHIGPVRMRSILNEAVERNELRKIANIELFKGGEDVLDRITEVTSVFGKKDLERVVKCIPNKERADKLVKEALGSERIVALYHENGDRAELYTTSEVREEELKILRLSGYIHAKANGPASMGDKVISKVEDLIREDQTLNEQQRGALSHLLFGQEGFRVLKGRAGTGKSQILGKVASISNDLGVEIIGLAPTHKAKQELGRVGYERCDTIRGFLFKLYNGRVDLVSGSTLVVDEAGMVGNDDFQELLRVAASNKCNVILAGDERQLSSVQRGGMFEVFADKYGCYEMRDILRQESEWGRSVASAFSKGDVKGGVIILANNNRIISTSSKVDSMEALLNNWNSSAVDVRQRLIITVKNKDVDTLNKAARELLKAEGIVDAQEYVISRKTKSGIIFSDTNQNEDSTKLEEDFIGFAKGDRIVFGASSKEYGINNGDFGKLKELSNNGFKVLLDNGKEVEFDPNKFSKFKHSYASTVYKAQGASIKDVYVLHDGFSTVRNSYVAMSRHIEDLHLYTNLEATRDQAQLVKQLSFNPEHSASINYRTREELDMGLQEQNKGLFANLGSLAKETITGFIDKNKIDKDYYTFEKPEINQGKVEEVLELIHEHKVPSFNQDNARQDANDLVAENRAVMEGYGSRSHIAAKDYSVGSTERAVQTGNDIAGVNHKKLDRGNAYAIDRFKVSQDNDYKIDYKYETEKLREAAKWGVEKIAKDFFGQPNQHLSNRTTLRFGENGKLAVRINGERAGIWYNFAESKGGDIFDLVQDSRGCDFKGAVSYLQDTLGVSRSSSLQLVWDSEASNQYVDYHKQANHEQALEKQRIRKIEGLVNRAVSIEEGSIAHQYLKEERGIGCELGSDIKTCQIFDKSLGKSMPAIVAFARDADGDITGGQQLLLDPEHAVKADVDIPRKSFGKISGSFVEVAGGGGMISEARENQVTIIAEGVETALSIKQAGIEAKILCSLGVSNIKNYNPAEDEKILIAADNDGLDAPSYLSVTKAALELENKGAIVKVVMPQSLGDFNDVLRQEGVEFVREMIEPKLNLLLGMGSVRDESFTAFKEMEHMQEDLRSFEPEGIGIDHNISSPSHITKEFTPSVNKELDNFLESHSDKLADIVSLNPKYDINSLKMNLEPLDKKEREIYIESTWLETFKNSVLPELEDINKERFEAKTVDELVGVLAREKEFCLKTYDQYWRLSVNLEYQEKNDHITRINALYHNKPELLESFTRDAHNISKFGIWDQDRAMDEITRAKDIVAASENLFTLCRNHIIKEIDKDLHHFKHNESLEHEGMKFDSAKSYLEHKMDDDHINCYLNGTRVATTLQDIYRHEQHLEQQKQLELEHHMEKGMGM